MLCAHVVSGRTISIVTGMGRASDAISIRTTTTGLWANSGFFLLWMDKIGPNACLLRLPPPFVSTLTVQAASLERRDLLPHL